MSLKLLLSSSLIDPASLPQAGVPALYVHIPFCFHKCHYCDFYSITRQTTDRMSRFVDLLLLEAGLWTQSAGPTVQPQTIFFGGGTPSLLPLEQMRRLLAGLRARFDLSRLEEWTLEANPATVSYEYCQMLREAGVDRMSFGAQSFNRNELATLERHHDPLDVPRSIDVARAAGFRRLNLDLIYGIPGQCLNSWCQSLEATIALRPSHISCYDLTYEPNTPMAVKKRLGLLQPVQEQLELEMFHHTRRRLRQVGLPAYEISNYASEPQQCRHNLIYWTGGNYIGLGPSAASHVDGHRFKNRPHLGEWEQAIESGNLPVIEHEVLSQRARAGELAMLMLRLTRPIDFSDFSERSGLDAREIFADPIARLSSAGLLAVDSRGFALTERGLELADAVAAEFLVACN